MTTTRTPGIQIGRAFGIPIYIDSSWLFIFAVITWSLGVQFTQQHPQWTRVQHWTIGALTSLLFFASILFHELSHSLVARMYKIRVESITLFVFEVSRASPTKPEARCRNSTSQWLDRFRAWFSPERFTG